MHPLLAIVLVLSPVGFYLSLFLSQVRKRKADPHALPGPTLLPFLGRIHDLPINFMWTKFQEWSKIYGPIYQTEMLGTKFIIIGTEEVAEDLLVKRAKLNSDRPEMKSLFDSKSTTGTMEYLPLMGKNKYWARGRKLTHAFLTQGTNSQYYGFMDHEAKRWMYRLLTEPETFQWTLEDMASKVMCSLVWDDHSHSAALIPSAWGLLTQMSPAGPITNIITPLWDHLPEPINPWKIAERKRHDIQQAWWQSRLDQVRAENVEGVARPSFTKQYLDMADKAPLSCDHEASSCLGMMAIVGVFTIGGPLNYFLLTMMMHPEVQQKAAEEIDRVVGHPPTLADWPKLPFLRACIRETMRWKPNVPTGVAHEAEQDQYYEGYFIEKGTRLLPLDVEFLRNPTKYPDPHNFRPERWVEPGWPTYQEPLTQYPMIKGMSSFGWGQRQCLGMNVTQDEMFIACGSLLYYYIMKYAKDKNGKDIPVDPNKSNSLLIIKPDKFEMAFEIRSEAKRRECIDGWMAADEKFESERELYRANGRRSKREAMEMVEKVVDEKLGVVNVNVKVDVNEGEIKEVAVVG